LQVGEVVGHTGVKGMFRLYHDMREERDS
jgi:hypothetical protein